jgi:predicted regulator of Ras-like GTPase activity (Roadblock/LC7/MglB family)
LDWILKSLASEIPQIRHIVVLSADGLRIAAHTDDRDAADRLAAACAGLQSLATAIGTEFPGSAGKMRLVVIEIDAGLFYLMEAATGSYLAVLAEDGVDSGLMGARMRDLVAVSAGTWPARRVTMGRPYERIGPEVGWRGPRAALHPHEGT